MRILTPEFQLVLLADDPGLVYNDLLLVLLLLLLVLHSRLQTPTGKLDAKNPKAPAGKTAQ